MHRSAKVVCRIDSLERSMVGQSTPRFKAVLSQTHDVEGDLSFMMMQQKRYAILGVGALGGYYGGLLAKAGFDTHFLLRSDYQHVKNHGLRVDSVHPVHGNFHLAPDLPNFHVHRSTTLAAQSRDTAPKFDVIVIGLKTTQSPILPEILPQIIADDGVVLTLQNGYHIEPGIAAIPGIGHDRVLGGLAFLCANKLGPGHIHHLDYGQIIMGEHQANGDPVGITPRLQSIVDDFNQAGIETKAIEDLVLGRWQKLVWNVPYNGLCTTLNVTTDVIMNDPQHRQHVHDIMLEVQAAAKAVDGKDVTDGFIQSRLDNTAKMAPYQPSMMLDAEAGRPLEVEAMHGEPVRAAEAVGCDAPLMRALYDELIKIDKQITNAASV